MAKRKRDTFPKEVAVCYDDDKTDPSNRWMLVGETIEEHANRDGWKDVGVYRLVRRVKTKLEAVTRIRK